MTRILVIDNYDSFVYTLVGYLQELGAEAVVVRNDQLGEPDSPGNDLGDNELKHHLTGFDGVLLSPGPGTPAQSGVCPALIRVSAAGQVPLFGVCLGHQAIAEVFGATVAHSPVLMHGKTSLVHHDGQGIFTDCRNPLIATRYHSLAIVDSTLPTDVFRATAHTEDGVIMAIEHVSAPMFGVQFHPESVRTEDGYLMIANFLERCGLTGAHDAALGRTPIASASMDK